MNAVASPRRIVFILALVCSALAPVLAQTPAAEFYMKYRKALGEAKRVEDLFPFVSAKSRKDMEQTPKDDREMMLGVLQMMNDQQDVKIVKESRTGMGVTLTVEAVAADKSKATGTVTLVNENGSFKIDTERWTER